MFHHFSLTSYLLVENPNVLKHIIIKQYRANQIKFYCATIILKIQSQGNSHKFLKARKLKMGAPSKRTN